ncbi:TPA: hypothetical protein JG855_004196 [Vibrio parahaemolyticus]|uniref:hypothetical protein n=3 Tax=Vibrio parahaemolyticus TaxID=670 RepID=UPI00111E2CF5|nr:hypothetical protein [Vibrio parahaemolyticus]EJV0371032.1 hypothetical protein [Vibrio vulnificus]EGQ9919316.1 hypothetical protein [Vibrio parahaemolyticus]MDF4357889.1 hypothetical protein [Vibrio parahaemolyticus]MDF4545098.1 hypothetical protein [Vibrio parahaemolyticus]MDG2580044.1 hypothetical protein [Vibrio parahaemolyticus]
MNNTIPSTTGKSVKEIHDDDIAADDYNQSTVQDLVIKHCIEKGFITSTDATTKTKKFLALKEAIDTALHAFQLVDNFDDTNITTDNLAACIEYKEKLKQRIIKVISDRLLINLPDLRR